MGLFVESEHWNTSLLIQPKQDTLIVLASSCLIRKALKHNGNAVEICKCRTDKLYTHMIPGLLFSICSSSQQSCLKNSSLVFVCLFVLHKKEKSIKSWVKTAVGSLLESPDPPLKQLLTSFMTSHVCCNCWCLVLPLPVLPDLPSILKAHWGLCYLTTGLHSSRCFWEQADPSGTRKAEPGDTGPAHTASASLTPPGVPSRTGTAASLASGIGDLTFWISPWWWSVKMGCFYPSERANSKNDF